MSDEISTYDRFMERYEAERVPWDDPLPPPEIVELAAELPTGRALDLGCGYGRTAIYLAGFGWQVDAIDFIPKAIGIARHRAAAAGVLAAARFHIASAADLSFLQSPYELVIDIGCMHSFTEAMLRAYRDEVARLLRVGGLYVLFAHLRDKGANENDERPHGIEEETVMNLMSGLFRSGRVEHGITQIEDRPPWHSAWFWFRRTAQEPTAANRSS